MLESWLVHCQGCRHDLVPGVTRWEGVSNENVYERCGMRVCGGGVQCSVVEWMKRSTLRWFDHIERMENEEFAKKVYMSCAEGFSTRGRPLGRWEDRVKEYMSEREVRGNGLERARKKCMDRERWRSICQGRFRRGQGVRAID